VGASFAHGRRLLSSDAIRTSALVRLLTAKFATTDRGWSVDDLPKLRIDQPLDGQDDRDRQADA